MTRPLSPRSLCGLTTTRTAAIRLGAAAALLLGAAACDAPDEIAQRRQSSRLSHRSTATAQGFSYQRQKWIKFEVVATGSYLDTTYHLLSPEDDFRVVRYYPREKLREPFEDSDNKWGKEVTSFAGEADIPSFTETTWQTFAVDAHFHASLVWDFFQDVLGRDGPGDGMHVEVALWPWKAGFASWNPNTLQVNLWPGTVHRDVIAHEMGHLFFAKEVLDLGALINGESLAVNEASSDITSVLVRFRDPQDSSVPWNPTDWVHESKDRRYFQRPSADHVSADAWEPDLMSKYGVHEAGGVGRRMFYFLSNGADPYDPQNEQGSSEFLPSGMDGLGVDVAAQLWFAMVEHYLQPTDGFVEARQHMLQAASDLYGPCSAEVVAVDKAWTAVNIGIATAPVVPEVDLRLDFGPPHFARANFRNSAENGSCAPIEAGSLSATGRNPAGQYDYDYSVLGALQPTESDWLSLELTSGYTYDLRASATDADGNQTVETLRVDLTPPTIANFECEGENLVTCSADLSDNMGLSALEVWADGERIHVESFPFTSLPVIESCTAPPCAGNPAEPAVFETFSYEIDLAEVLGHNKRETVPVEFVVFDYQGNTDEALDLRLGDTSPPLIYGVSPTTYSNGVLVEVDFRECTLPVDVFYWVDGPLLHVDQFNGPFTSSTECRGYSSLWLSLDDYAPGSHEVEVHVRDAYGNESLGVTQFYVEEPDDPPMPPDPPMVFYESEPNDGTYPYYQYDYPSDGTDVIQASRSGPYGDRDMFIFQQYDGGPWTFSNSIFDSQCVTMTWVLLGTDGYWLPLTQTYSDGEDLFARSAYSSEIFPGAYAYALIVDTDYCSPTDYSVDISY